MIAYLNQLSLRERYAVLVAIAVVVFYLYFTFLYNPLTQKLAEKNAQLIEKTQTLSWMKSIRPKALALKSSKSLDNNQLLTLMENQLKQRKTFKFPFELQQTASGEIDLSFAKVPFQSFVRWLMALNQEYQFTMKQFDADATDTPGVTQLRVLLGTQP